MTTPDSADLADEVARLRRELGGSVVVAAHHYQRPEIVAHADFVGDSYKLALEASRSGAGFIVLAGVRFMAESAAILAAEGSRVLIPDAAAGCPMADMIDSGQARAGLARAAAASALPVVPVTYMNSYADVKAFTGEAGGSACTSSNAAKVVAHYLERDRAVFFLPDRNLGMNTAARLAIPQERIFTLARDGGIQGRGDPSRALLFLWDGFCHVHKRFTVEDVAAARRDDPGISVIVHPECDPEVVRASDSSGSTEAIYKAVEASPRGSRWAVGTEASFVERLAGEFPDRVVRPLRVSTCLNMSRITLERLRSSLASIADFRARKGLLLFPVVVGEELRRGSELCLRAMLDIVEAGR